jgi:hypothetical protein
VGVLGDEAVGELVHVQRADQHRPGGGQALDGGGVMRGGGASRRIFEPAIVVTPSMSNRFFTANGTPASGPTGRSAARSASIASAWARARSAKTAV